MKRDENKFNFNFFIITETGSSKLSSFSTGKTGSVQMRRTTNKKGKTAPAPPKRTR
jgi:abelson tyrosine-protein kinase 1